MTFRSFVRALAGGAMCACAAGQDLPAKDPGDVFDWEPAILLQDVPKDSDETEGTPTPGTTLPVATAQARLDAVRKKQQRWEKLTRQGVLSRMEYERCTLEVAEAVVAFERARAAETTTSLVALRQRAAAGNIDPAMVTAAEAGQKSAEAMADSAERQLHKSRLEIARTNVDRYKRLVAGGVSSRNQLRNAEARVRKLEEAAQQPAHPAK